MRAGGWVKFCKTCGELYEDDSLELCPEDDTPLKLIHEKSADEDPMLGQMVDRRFRIVSMLGKGGFGAVYRAVQTSVGREVAIKFILEGMPPEGVRRFMREAKATSALRNVHTVTIYDFGQNEDGKLYLAMEMLEGDTLRDRLTLMGQLPWKECLHVISQVAESLEEAHTLGMIHRDLKPGNIMLTEMGGDHSFVKVLDFGIAKFQDQKQSQITHTGSTLGSPSYMSPEQARGGELTAASDLYSCGIMLYEMLCGRVPFVADQPVQVLFKHCTDAPPPMSELNPNADIPPEVNALVQSLLEKKPENRPASAMGVKQRIQAILGGESSQELTMPVATFGTQPRVQQVSQPVSGMEMTISAQPPPGPGSLESIQAMEESGEMAGSPSLEATGHLQQISTELPQVQKKSPVAFAIAAAVILGVGGFMLMPSAEEAPAETQAKQASKVEEQKSPPTPEAETPEAPEVKPAAANTEPVAAAAAKPAAPEAAPKMIRLVTKPAGALVRDVERKLIGETPLELTTHGNDRVFSFEKAGYITASHAVSGAREGDIVFELAPTPKAKPKPKRARKRVRPSKKPAAAAPKPKPKPKKRKSRDLF